MLTDKREVAYKKLRAAAHRLLCNTQDLKGGGVKVTPSFLKALDRALEEADAAEAQEKNSEESHTL